MNALFSSYNISCIFAVKARVTQYTSSFNSVSMKTKESLQEGAIKISQVVVFLLHRNRTTSSRDIQNGCIFYGQNTQIMSVISKQITSFFLA